MKPYFVISFHIVLNNILTSFIKFAT